MPLPTNMKHLLNDGLPGERPPKRHSTSPPSLPTFSSPLTPTPADEMEDRTVIATHSTPPKSISEHYTYFSEQGKDSTPTETRSGHMASLVSTECEAEDSQGQGEPETEIEADLLGELQTADNYMEVMEPVLPEEPSRAQTPTTSVSQSLRDYCKLMYGKLYVPLQDLTYPDECRLHPEHKDELFDAFLENVTVIVTVWTNYDGLLKQFFGEHEKPRFQDCGKVYLSPEQRTRLEMMDNANGLEMKNVQLNVGTPFRTFFTLYFQHDGEKKVLVNGEVFDYYGLGAPHKPLFDLVVQNMEECSNYEQWFGKAGLNLTDLDNIARLFLGYA